MNEMITCSSHPVYTAGQSIRQAGRYCIAILARLKPFNLVLLILTLLAPLQEAAADSAKKGILDSLSSLGDRLGFSSDSEQPFLNPDKAFIFSADVKDGHTVIARWEIADGYYLYRDKFAFKLPQARGIQLGAPASPAGKFKVDESFGKMEVYYHQTQFSLPLIRDNTSQTPITLEAQFQGCAEAGFCYPPITKTIDLIIPSASASTPTGFIDDGSELPEQDRIANILAGDSALLFKLMIFFGAGLLLAFTPCVFPMVPILSSIIVGQGAQVTTRRAFTLSAIYVLAMALTYTAAGILAGMFGKNLQIMFQNPWIISLFSIVFVVLALSMFGFYELQMPQCLQTRLSNLSNKQAGGSFLGVGVMGVLSALIVGPCIAAPLAAALIVIGQTGDAVLGGSALFALSLGMGLPLLLIGTSAGTLLPKAGAWMTTIKAVFGVLLLGLAIWMLERIIAAEIAMYLWACLLIGSAVYMGAVEKLSTNATGWQKLWKGCGIALLIYGGLLIVGAASGGRDVFHPLQDIHLLSSGQTAEARSLDFKQIKGVDGLTSALRQAAARHQAVMLDFYADWCVDCKIMEKRTFSNPQVQQTLAGTLLLQADVTANDELDQALLKHFGLWGPPAIMFFDVNGQELPRHRLIGLMEPEEFRLHAGNAIAAGR